MLARTGTSGFAFKEWKGEFYPPKTPDAGMLAYYATRFPAVEINNTFYRMPKESVLVNWAGEVPGTFRFALKASQKITHFKRLQDVGDELGYFLRVASALGEKRGPTLFQLPPNLKKDLARLTDFLAQLPHRWQATIEFRHASWFAEDVYDALRKADVALCIADTEDLSTPVIPTAAWGYARLHRETYDAQSLAAWADRLRNLPWSETYVFFKHDLSTGPDAATAFAGLMGGR